MVTITLHCPHCGSDALVRDGHAPNGKQKYRVVMPVDVAAARIRRPLPIQKPVARRSCMPIKSAAVCVALRARLAYLAPPCPPGSKKTTMANLICRW